MPGTISEEMVADLKKSGLDPKDMRTRLIEEPERNACGITSSISGYVIPYYDINGEPLPFYRMRLFDNDPKYRQLKDSVNHLYFPQTFSETFAKSKRKTVFITEGEKKAQLLTKLGYPAIALSGVDSWKNRAIILPKDTVFSKLNIGKEVIKASLPPQSNAMEAMVSGYANGFDDLLDFGIANKITFIIVYDSDYKSGVKPQVQRAAAVLGYELRAYGFAMKQIKQMILPTLGEKSMSVDDYIMHDEGGRKGFDKLFAQTLDNVRAFPRHPNVRDYINKKLQTSKLPRKVIQSVALALITELDNIGFRMYSEGEGQMYYFDSGSSSLMKVSLNTHAAAGLQDTAFGKLLYIKYGISPSADIKLMQWLGAQFSAEDPITAVDPHRIIARPRPNEDAMKMQISDSHYVRVSEHGTEILQNGDDGILFEAGHCDAIDVDKFKQAMKDLRGEPLTMWWDEVLTTARLKHRGNHQTMLALLYYVSPWLYRWQGSQMPVELVIGESGSGKSSLCELRLAIQTGRAALKNAPTDIKDWNAAISNSGGLHVTDNVQLLNKALRTTLSDEICRLITEPQPHVEMRKYYTTTDIMRIKVDNVFCFTAIAQPFMAADLLQRAIILDFDKSTQSNLTYDSSWKARQLSDRGGREYWLAHHFLVLEKFFQVAKKLWNPNYKAQHRLINFEQSLMLMAKEVFEIDSSWIPKKLAQDVSATVAANDFALEGLKVFAAIKYNSNNKDMPFSTKDIAKWAENNGDYESCQLLVNARKLGIHISNTKHMIHQIAGITEIGKKANRMMYTIDEDIVKEFNWS